MKELYGLNLVIIELKGWLENLTKYQTTYNTELLIYFQLKVYKDYNWTNLKKMWKNIVFVI